jgi:methionyl-tRNA synthetase
MNLARVGNQYFQKSAPWELQKTDPELCGTVLHTCAVLLKNLAVLGAPFVPFTAQSVWEMLAQEGSVHDQRWADIGSFTLEAGQPIAEKWKVPVSKVADKEIAKQQEKLAQSLAASKQEDAPEVELPELQDQITIDDVAKLDLRAGKILEAEKVKKSKKLIKMRIDIGLEVRQIVAGIGQHYAPEDLVGKTVIVVANLQPAKLMGIESQGMVLAGVLGDDLCVTAFDKAAIPGTVVR